MYAESHGWKLEIASINETELGGVKDCSACGLPHSEAGYAYITRKYPEIMEIAKQNSNANEE